MKRPGLSLDSVRSVTALRIALVLGGIGLLAASARLSVPFYPVPLTMQTLAVLLVGGLFGPGLGATTVMGYLAVGAAGAPVFANGFGGVAVLIGPTGGYLVGFVAAAWLMGWVSRKAGVGAVEGGRLERAKKVALLAVGAVAAEVVIYVFGVPWLAASTGMGLREAVAAGLVPFLLGDALKMAVAIAALRLVGRRLSGRSLLTR